MTVVKSEPQPAQLEVSPLPPDLPGDGSRLVFLVGCPRSGTTWLQRLLAAHPHVRTGQESNIFQEYLAPAFSHFNQGILSARGGVGMGCYLTRAQFLEVQRQYMGLLMQPMLAGLEPGQLFLEKTPQHALNLKEIAQLLPQARIIHLLRDPRDVVASMLAASKGWGSGWAPRDAGEAAVAWEQHVKAARAGASHFASHQFLELRYEELLANPEAGLGQCAQFLGLEWSPQQIQDAIAANRAGDKKAGDGTAIQLGGEAAKIGAVVQEPEGFVRRAQAGGWQQDLAHRDQFRVWRLLHQYMQETGYRWTPAQDRSFGRMAALRQLVRRRRAN